MKLALINPLSYQPEAIWNLNQNIKRVEKNWIPFVSEENILHFIYNISPHKVLRVAEEEKVDFLASDINDIMQDVPWDSKWGVLHGGTPAVLVNGEYLSFFHSRFIDKEGITWYVMGAATFESKPPYRATAISQFPLLFKNIYNSKHSELANPALRCIFPSGIEVEEINGKTFIHVACGENDSAIKVVTMDFKKLKAYMNRASTQTLLPQGSLEL